MMRLDPQMIERFREDGFLAFDTGLPGDTIAALRETLTRLHNEKVGFEEGALFDAMGFGRPMDETPMLLTPGVLEFTWGGTLHMLADGKVDYSALPLLNVSNTLPETEFVEPQTLVERRLAAILAPLLHVERVSAKDNFFLLGGHSLLGTQLITKIKEAFDVELSLLGLFDHPTLEEMSVEVENLILVKIGAGNGDASGVSRAVVQESQ